MSSRARLALHFLFVFVLFASFFLRLPIMWDTDSYYHVAVARLYGTEGLGATIPWARFSLLSNGGDKEFLFHVLLIPFAKLPDPAIGGRLALAVFNASIATVIAALAVRGIGPLGYAVPLWLWIAAPPFFAREVRLRPELLALLIILLAIPAAARRNWKALAILTFAFTLGYTAFHVFLVLCALWFAWDWYERKRPTFSLIAAPVAGAALGLFAHPHPLANLRIWYVQNVAFFANMQRLDVGDEILRPNLPRIAYLCAAWILALALLRLVVSRPPGEGGWKRSVRGEGYRQAWIAAIVFTLLFFGFARMATMHSRS